MDGTAATSEENKTNEEIHQHDQQTLETSNILDQCSLNLTENSRTLKEESQENLNEPPGASTNESATESSGNSVDIDVNKGNSQVKATPRELENQVLSEVLNLLTAELPELEYEEVEDEDEDMSRLNVKAKTPSKTNSRPSLSHVSPKAPAELTGQASPKVTKEDAKYWKTREQELLEKISMLESKMGGSEAPKYYGPVDQVAAQRQEKLEEDLSGKLWERTMRISTADMGKENEPD